MSCQGDGVSASFVAEGSTSHVIPEPSYGLRAPEKLDQDYNRYLNTDEVSFADWGELQISGDAPKTWFTLTSAEWNYLLNQRVGENGRNLRANVKITGVQNHPAGSTETTIKGFMLFPDDWTDDDIPSGITNFSYGSVNSISYDDWRRFEAAGAVFLPAAGWRNPDYTGMGNVWIGVEHTYNDGYYWTKPTSTYAGESDYMYYQFHATNYLFNANTRESEWHYGQSVRLVKPAPGYTYSDAGRSTWGPVSSK